jgi:hypothetical protein
MYLDLITYSMFILAWFGRSLQALQVSLGPMEESWLITVVSKKWCVLRLELLRALGGSSPLEQKFRTS